MPSELLNNFIEYVNYIKQGRWVEAPKLVKLIKWDKPLDADFAAELREFEIKAGHSDKSATIEDSIEWLKAQDSSRDIATFKTWFTQARENLQKIKPLSAKGKEEKAIIEVKMEHMQQEILDRLDLAPQSPFHSSFETKNALYQEILENLAYFLYERHTGIEFDADTDGYRAIKQVMGVK